MSEKEPVQVKSGVRFPVMAMLLPEPPLLACTLTTFFTYTNPVSDSFHMLLLFQSPDSQEVISSVRQTISIIFDVLLPGDQIPLCQTAHDLVQSGMLQARELGNDRSWHDMVSARALLYGLEDAEFLWEDVPQVCGVELHCTEGSEEGVMGLVEDEYGGGRPRRSPEPKF